MLSDIKLIVYQKNVYKDSCRPWILTEQERSKIFEFFDDG